MLACLTSKQAAQHLHCVVKRVSIWLPVQVTDPSLLRFLVDLRDADLSDKQLRDDLMTMLIAGHETTAAVLTWTLFGLMTHPDVEAKLLAEIDSVLGDRTPGESQHPANGDHVKAAGLHQVPASHCHE